ncbi:hypothetical protein BV898_09484 [Hypsibius exemplaris]|uniref:Microspherule protein N-terminal domain-containing protein n=1 Tax=Hypsibius exemplaris TaxID=2072580 RepID=A0A1W0WMB0_HYPEX|nr:hypothetical protein BV898_09484 [Hypsibius exemplaris]
MADTVDAREDDDGAGWADDREEDSVAEEDRDEMDASDDEESMASASTTVATRANGDSLRQSPRDGSRPSSASREGQAVSRIDGGASDSGSSPSRRVSNLPLTAAQLSEIQDQNERRSARFVKRKKFDDETVEASLRPAYYRNRTGPEKSAGGKGPPQSEPQGRPSKSTAPASSASFHQHRSRHKKASHTASSPRTGEGSPPKLRIKRIAPKPDLIVEPEDAAAAPPVVVVQNFGFGGGFEPFDQALENGGTAEREYASGLDRNVSNTTESKKKMEKAKKSPMILDEPASRKAWAAMDDLKLISALPQLFDFALVAKYVSFSTKVEAGFLEQRWEELLNDAEACRESVEGLDRIPLDTIQRIRKMKFYTDIEEEAIKSVVAADATLDHFEGLLADYDRLFLPGRQAEDLQTHWKYISQRVKTELGREPPESNPELPEDLPRLRARNRVSDIQTNASCFGQALISYTGHLNYRSKHIGTEVAYLKAISERIATASLPDQQRPKFHRDHKSTLAFLCGVCVDYAIVNDEATFGYSDENTTVDIDLSLEGNIVNLVPFQGLIYLDIAGMFHIENYGQSTISVNGFPLEGGNDFELPDNSAVDIGTLTFQFYKNVGAVKKFVERAVADSHRQRNISNNHNNNNVIKPKKEESSPGHGFTGSGHPGNRAYVDDGRSDSPESDDSSENDGINGRPLYMDLEDERPIVNGNSASHLGEG